MTYAEALKRFDEIVAALPSKATGSLGVDGIHLRHSASVFRAKLAEMARLESLIEQARRIGRTP